LPTPCPRLAHASPSPPLNPLPPTHTAHPTHPTPAATPPHSCRPAQQTLTGEKFFTQVPTFAHEAVIQMITMTTFILALLLTLRLNRTYERWWDAWRNFRRLGDCAVALTQQATVLAPSEPGLQGEVARWAVLWCYSVMQFCAGAPAIDPLARQLLSPAEACVYDAAPNKFNFVELKLRKLIARMKLPAGEVGSREGRRLQGSKVAPGPSGLAVLGHSA
jgi:hypothetical protein